MTILDSPLRTPPDRVPTFDVLGWVLRVAAGGIFLSVGLTKFESQSLWVGLFAQIGLGDWFRYLTGALQVTGGALFLIPRTTRIAAVIAGSTMVGAISKRTICEAKPMAARSNRGGFAGGRQRRESRW